jgi:hypothetical protein
MVSTANFSVLEKLLADGVRRVRVGWAIKGKELRALAYTLECHTSSPSPSRASFPTTVPTLC